MVTRLWKNPQQIQVRSVSGQVSAKLGVVGAPWRGVHRVGIHGVNFAKQLSLCGLACHLLVREKICVTESGDLVGYSAPPARQWMHIIRC
jgi:hypothetical protein